MASSKRGKRKKPPGKPANALAKVAAEKAPTTEAEPKLPTFEAFLVQLHEESEAWALRQGYPSDDPLRTITYIKTCLVEFELVHAQRTLLVAQWVGRRRKSFVRRWRVVCGVLVFVAAVIGSTLVTGWAATALHAKIGALVIFSIAAGVVVPLARDIGIEDDIQRQKEWEGLVAPLSLHIKLKLAGEALAKQLTP